MKIFQTINIYNSPVNYVDQTHTHQEIIWTTYHKSQHTFSLTLTWNFNGNTIKRLKFQVHWKSNQKLIYLNKSSTHTNATFKEIPSNVFNWITKINSRTEKTLKWKWTSDTQDTPMLFSKLVYLRNYFQALNKFGGKWKL